MTTPTSPLRPCTRPPLAPAAPVFTGSPTARPSAQSAYGRAVAARPGAAGAAGTPAGRVQGPVVPRLNTGLEPLTGEGVWSGWRSVVGSVVAWCALGLGLAMAVPVVGWILP